MVDLVAVFSEPRRRCSLEHEPDSRHQLTSVVTGSTETISGLIDTRHEVPPDPRAFDKPRRPAATARPLPAPPPDTRPRCDQKPPLEARNAAPESRIPLPMPELQIDKEIRLHYAEQRPLPDPWVESRSDRCDRTEKFNSERCPERDGALESRLVGPESRGFDQRAIILEPKAVQERGLDQRVIIPEPKEKRERNRPELIGRAANSENKYELKPPPRQQSLPATSDGGQQPPKSRTMPRFPSEDVGNSYENVDLERRTEGPVPGPKINPLTHDHNGRKYKDSVSYENINLDYIARLVSEGYPKEVVVRALGITRNDMEMACDILHEFGSKVPQT